MSDEQEAKGIDRPTCGTCPYFYDFEDYGGEGNDGECHIQPPVERRSDPADRAAPWPLIDSANQDFCGSHPRFKEWLEYRYRPGEVIGAPHQDSCLGGRNNGSLS